MTLIPVTTPVALKTASATFTLDSQTFDFSDHISQIQVDPSTTSGSWTAITGKTIQSISASTWAATLSLVQDMAQTGFLRWLQTNEGRKVQATFTFEDGTDPMEVTINVAPASIGGQADGSTLQSTVTLVCDGSPQWLS